MKRKLSLMYFLLFSLAALSQSAFDEALINISTDLSGKLKTINKGRVVVLYITDINKQVSTAGKYLADVISVDLINSPGITSVFDRENLSDIEAAKNLYNGGYAIDSGRAAQLGRALNVDVIIVGNYTVLSKTVKLTLKALNSVNGFIIAASIKDLPLNADAAALLGISINSNDPNGTSTSNQGFNHPLNSNEQINNPETVDKSCETKNTGDYCFTNNTKYNVRVHVSVSNENSMQLYSNDLTLSPGQTQCFYQIPAMVAKYFLYFSAINPGPSDGYSHPSSVPGVLQGDLMIEKCKSKTFNIR